MVRGPRHHLKHIAAPKSWMLDKLTGSYAPRPSNGPHKLREALPLVVRLFPADDDVFNAWLSEHTCGHTRV